MSISIKEAVIIIVIVAICTWLTRYIPFAMFGGKREVPKAVQYLGKILPSAMMATLVVYCLRNVKLFQGAGGIPEFISIAVVVGLHIWKRNNLLSIGLGTLCYMLLVQFVF